MRKNTLIPKQVQYYGAGVGVIALNNYAKETFTSGIITLKIISESGNYSPLGVISHPNQLKLWYTAHLIKPLADFLVIVLAVLVEDL